MRLFLSICFLLINVNYSFAVDSYADLVEEIIPSVVNISTRSVANENDGVDNFMINSDLTGKEGLGSGFFIRDDGYVLSNYHVIKGAKEIVITTSNNNEYQATIIGIDEASDLAVIKISPKDNEKFEAVKFGNANLSRVGDIVLTFGNPYGLGISVSQGIISAKNTTISSNNLQYLQTDAAINQGNSGGPMFNMEGEVIGINTAIFTTPGASGIGFALPSNVANWVAEQLIENGKVKRGWIGFNVGFGVDRYTNKPGLVITEINDKSNAYKEGLRVGDVIITYNDTPANNLTAFSDFVEKMEPQQPLRLRVLSNGTEFREVIRIQDMPEDILKKITSEALSSGKKYAHKKGNSDVFYISELKITAKEVSPKGLAIVNIEKNSPLFNKGIKNGDVILEADSASIYSVDNLLESIRYAEIDDFRELSLLIQSDYDAFYVKFKMVAEND